MKRQGRYNRKNNTKKERIIMIASSVFVLAALTMTGVYVKNNSEKAKNDGYNIDFSSLESNAGEKYEEIQSETLDQLSQVTEDDLDYTPMEQVDGGSVEIPGLTNQVTTGIGGPSDEKQAEIEDFVTGMNSPQNTEETEPKKSDEEKDQAAISSDAGEKTAEQTIKQPIKQQEPSFSSGDTLVWPVVGNVLVPYSMDKTVYFSTLAQYKYNPALVISATEGDSISAAAGGKVTNVFYDEEIGNAVTMNIGNGYEATYGQLKDITVSLGDYVEKGNLVGYVAAPTKYYSVEGTNAYFALTLNGEPVDPMGQLQ